MNISEKKGEERESRSLKVLKSAGSLSEDLSTTSASGWSNGAGAGVPRIIGSRVLLKPSRLCKSTCNYNEIGKQNTSFL